MVREVEGGTGLVLLDTNVRGEDGCPSSSEEDPVPNFCEMRGTWNVHE